MSFSKTPVTLCCVTILAVAIPLSLRMTKAAATAATPAPEASLQGPEGGGAGGGASQSVSLGVVMHRTGLTPEALAAAGLGEASTMSVGGAAQLANTGLVTSLRDLDHAVGQARNARDAAERKIQSGKASPEEVAAFPGLEQAFATASAARDTAVNGLFAAATEGLNSTQRATLTAIRANAHWKLPTEFLVVERTEAEWVELRAALANERIAARNEEAPNQQCQALLGTARANPAVAAAKTALDTNLATVKQSWNTVTGD
jgi:hypothetical protein